MTGSQKQTTEIYSHRHSNLISTILCTYTDTPPDIHANLKPQANEFGKTTIFTPCQLRLQALLLLEDNSLVMPLFDYADLV